MENYKDKSGNSGISKYEIGNEFIKIQFKHGGTYEYRSSKIGFTHFSKMKKLALDGIGLNSYINTNDSVKNGYSSKLN